MSLPELLVQVAARGTALLLLTALAGFLFRRASASTRHLIWTGGLAVSLVAPLVSAPDPALPVLPTFPAHPSAVPEKLESQAQPWSGTLTDPAPGNAVERVNPQQSVPKSGVASDNSGVESLLTPDSRLSTLVDWPGLLALIWLIGLAAAGLRLVAGWIAIARLARNAVPVAAPEWRETIWSVLATHSSRRPIRFLESAEVVTPCTWGTLEPTVLLPAVGADWTAEERRQVVVHELAHVRRFDCATQLLSGLAVALHWFNPLAWYAQRACRVAREQACDDAVLAAGGTASTYASLLLAAAAPEGGPWMPAEAQAMARRSQIGDRLLAVLDPARRRNPVDRRAVGWISATAFAAAIPVASVGIRPATPPQVAPAPPAMELTENSAPSTVVRQPVLPPVVSRPAAIRAGGTEICDPNVKTAGRKSRSSSASYSDDGGDGGSKWYSLTWSGPNCSVSIRSRGDVSFTSAEDDVASLSNGGRFEIQAEDGSITRSYLVTSRSGTLERRYRVNDEDARLDSDGLKWRAALILEFIRRTGYDAEARAARIRKRGGVDALVEEIGAINSDGVRSAYLKVALDDPSTSAPDAARLLTLTQGIGSDGDRARVLASTPVALLGDKSVQLAYADGAKGIGSDGDLSSVLISALSSGKLTAGSCEWVLGLVEHIGSDGDRSRVLVTATDALQWNSGCVRRALELTRAIGSDGDKARTLIRFLQKHGLPGDLIPVFFQTTATIGSDGDHSSVLHRVIDLESPSDAVVAGLLEDSRRIGSDGDHSGVLVAAARRGLVKSERLRSAYRDSARGIGSDGDREAALRALERS